MEVIMTDREKGGRTDQNLNLLLEESGLRGLQCATRYPGRRLFGFFCSYWPEELVLASGMEPIRLLPADTNANPAELPAYSCSLARGCLYMAAQGKFRGMAGVGFAHTCDTMQCLGGIWEESFGKGATIAVVPPVTLKAPGAEKYYKNELSGLLVKLGGLSGKRPGSAEIGWAVRLCDRIRSLATGLDELRPMLPSALVSAILRSGQVMPREEYAAALESALPSLQEMASDPEDRHRLLVSGAVLESDSLFQMIDELGGRVVADDTCSGYRHYSGPPWQGEGDPLDAVVRRYTQMALCPCRSRGIDERTGYLAGLAQSRQAKGAILVIRKCCDPHAWDAVPAAKCLQTFGIRVLVLELEGSEIGGQERTRLQAFLESM